MSVTDLPLESQVAGGKISFERRGSGPPCVVLHHSISNHGWIPFHEQLAERFTVHVPDLPGFGESDRPDWARSVRDLAIILEQWLDDLSLEGVTLVGLGFGGWVAAELATMHQARLARLALVGAPGLRPREGEIVDQLEIDYVDYLRTGFENTEAFEAWFSDDPPRDTRMLLYGGREMTMRVTFKPWMFNQSLPHLLPGVKTPAVVVWGRHDRIVPIDVGRQYAELLPNAGLLVLEDAGHFVEFESPDALVGAVVDA